MYYVCEMCVCLIQLTDSDHLLCPYFQKSTDSKNKQKKSRAKLTVSHMSGSFHVVLKAVILQEKSAEVSRQGRGGVSCSRGTDEPHKRCQERALYTFECDI